MKTLNEAVRAAEVFQAEAVRAAEVFQAAAAQAESERDNAERRRNLWCAVAAAVAASSNVTDFAVVTAWADKAVAEFDRRCKRGDL